VRSAKTERADAEEFAAGITWAFVHHGKHGCLLDQIGGGKTDLAGGFAIEVGVCQGFMVMEVISKNKR
jgi:hypothetical protein